MILGSSIFVGSHACVGDLGLLLEQLVDAQYGGGAALEEVDDVAEGDHGPEELDDVDVERCKLAEADSGARVLVVQDDHVAAYQQRDDEAEAEDHFERGPEHGHEADEVERARDVLAVGGFEAVDLGVFLGEGADETRAGEVLLRLGGDVGELGLDALKAAMDALAEGLHEDRGERKRTDGAERELWTDANHEGKGRGGEDEAVGGIHDGGAEELTDGVEVIGGARHDVAGAVRMVIPGGLAGEVLEHVVAEIELDLARGADDDLAGDVEEDAGQRGDEQKPQRVVDDARFGDAIVLHVVHGVADDERQQHADDVIGDDGDCSPCEVLPVTAQIGEERSDLVHG